MSKSSPEIIHLNSVTQALELMGLEKPNHPLIAVARHKDKQPMDFGDLRFSTDLYVISMKDGMKGSIGYGRSTYDFEDGLMTFIAPGQVLSPGKIEMEAEVPAWSIIFHPDLIRNSELGTTIDDYSFFDYEVNEALFLSDKEKQTLGNLVQIIQEEIQQNTDKHTNKLIISNLGLLLDYCNRFYDRQFYTRANINKDVVSRFEKFLKDYFKTELQVELGLPSVTYCAKELGISANYLSDLLKKETGKTAHDHIQLFVIEKAKTILLNSNLTISEVAVELGFEYSQHFSKMFKSQTGMTPKEYRNPN